MKKPDMMILEKVGNLMSESEIREFIKSKEYKGINISTSPKDVADKVTTWLTKMGYR